MRSVHREELDICPDLAQMEDPHQGKVNQYSEFDRLQHRCILLPGHAHEY
jgi:hypothetical protein